MLLTGLLGDRRNSVIRPSHVWLESTAGIFRFGYRAPVALRQM